MKLAFALFKYFPYGGLQRDFLKVARACREKGHDVVVYTMSWQGEAPEEFEIKLLPVRALSNHRKYAKFYGLAMDDLKAHPVDRVVGFNKMPGLDFYFVADPCYENKARHSRGPLYRLSPRYAFFHGFEAAVFGRGRKTKLLTLSETQKSIYQHVYRTEEARFYPLPPGIERVRREEGVADRARRELRRELGVAEGDSLTLLVGSGFKTKGLDRALLALSALPTELRQRTHLIAIGQDNPRPFLFQAKRLGLSKNFRAFGGRDDIPRFLAAADLLVHPAYHETAGAVLLEALVCGLPVLATPACGYAHYVIEADAGLLTVDPFRQNDMNEKLLRMLTAGSDIRQAWRANALAFADKADLYSMPEKAAEIILGEETR